MPMQRGTIRELAARCSMTVCDHLLARSYDYEPKQRLTRMQTDTLATLNNCRSDIINYTSALRGMSADRRRQLFNDHVYMLGWLNELRKLANWQDLMNLAVVLFIGMAGGPATVSSNGGGGSSTDNNWGRDKDSDDLC